MLPVSGTVAADRHIGQAQIASCCRCRCLPPALFPLTVLDDRYQMPGDRRMPLI
jgi:hypothetical protein